MSGPLADLRVIELCDELGQLAGKLLADMGADVVKVEPPAGSSARRVGPFVKDIPGPNRSLNFWYYNTNKRSAVLDFEGDAGAMDVLRQLILHADVLIEDRAPGHLVSLGLDLEALRRANPRLIVCSITPFGQDGPWAHYRSSDLVGLAAGGPMGMNGYSPEDVEGAPPIHGKGDQAYNTACHFAVMGILAALLHRDLTGQGQAIDCSMHEALNSTTEVGLPHWIYSGKNVIRQTGRHAALHRTEPWLKRAKDGRYVLVFGVGRWEQLKAWMQEHGFGLQFDEPRFDDPLARQAGRGTREAAEIYAELDRFIGSFDAEFIYRGAQSIRLPWGPVLAPHETLDDPHWRDRGFFVSTTGEGVDHPVEMPGAPYIFTATPWELRRPAPKLGEHTAEVLAEIGRPSMVTGS
ncbi:MAG: CaiB/BaiF CoA-transferase family protein [Dehalococcoidia bacterium]